jgi:hypothetical protein
MPLNFSILDMDLYDHGGMIIWQYDIEFNDIKNVNFKQKINVSSKLRSFWKV